MNKITSVSLSALLLSTLVLGAGTALAAEEKSYGSNGQIEFIMGEQPVKPVDPTDPTKPVDPVDPTNPGGEPEPGTGGPLSIDFASSLDFGKNEITNDTITYYANPQTFKGDLADETRANYVQVSDLRGNNAGWTLTVKQNQQFTSETAKKFKVLDGSTIAFSAGKANSASAELVTAPTTGDFTLDPAGATSIVMSAAADTGVGTWTNTFGIIEDMQVGESEVTVEKNKAIALEIPGATPKEAALYKTTLTWTLTDTPGK